MVPELENAAHLVSMADIFIIIGTSLQVYPAASLINYAPSESIKYYIDPHASQNYLYSDIHCINKKATEGVSELVHLLLN
jgi:NAD-dependent deacetylase